MKNFCVSALAHSVRMLRAHAFAPLLALTIWSPMSISAQIPVASRIVAAINPNQRVTLTGSTPAIARAEYDQGAVADNTPANHVVLVLKRSDEQEATLKQLIDQMHSKGSANYQQWLKPQEFASRFGPSDADLATVTGWLQQNGFTVNKVSAGKVAIDFSGTAGQIKSAFHTELHNYTRNGETFHSNNQDPQIPAALAPVITGLQSLNDIKPARNMNVLGTANFNPQNHTATPNWDYGASCRNSATGVLGPCTLYVPAPGDLAVQYNLTSLQKAGTTGKGITLGVISASNVDLGIVQNYRTLFGFNPANLPEVIVDGGDPGQTNAQQEAYLDIEAIAAMAPDATTNLYVSGDTITTSGLVTAIVRAVDDDVADILTLSYGECEQQLGPSGNQFFNQFWEQAAAQGQTVFVSSGDDGSAGCDNFDTEAFATQGLAVSGFTSTPYNTSVGGTDFYYNNYTQGQFGAGLVAELGADWGGNASSTSPAASLVAPIAEQPWNQGFGLNINHSGHGTSIVAGSGGASTCVSGAAVSPTTGAYGVCTAGYAKPSWQTGVGVPTDGVRDIPDVSLFASSGPNLAFWPICASIYDCRTDLISPGYSISVTAIGGTSASSPAMAGIMALVDQTQKGRQGNANYTLYALATQYPNSFNDITIGSNNVACTKATPNCSLDTGDTYYSLQNYPAAAGYDQASGLGTINGANLIANWSKVSFNAAPKASTTTLALAQTTFVHGTPVPVTATVKGAGGTPSGSVSLVASSTLPGQSGQGTIALLNGSGTESIRSLPGGTYDLTADYPGDGVFGSSASQPVSLKVSPEPSTLVLTGEVQDVFHTNAIVPLTNGLSLPLSEAYYFEAKVAGTSGSGLATGVVTFMDGQTVLGTATVNSANEAFFATGSLLAGPHTITAQYSGDSSFNASNSSSISFTTTKGITEVQFQYTPFVTYTPKFARFVYAGQTFDVVAQIDGGIYSPAPSGTATFTFGSTSQTLNLNPSFYGAPLGTATATFTPTVPGTYVLNVSYSGDANYLSGVDTNPATLLVVLPTLAPTTTNLTSSTTSIGPDGVITLTGIVTGSINGTVPTGNIYFDVRGASLYTKLDSTGKAVVTIAGYQLIPGSNQILAEYGGDTNYAASNSQAVTIAAIQGDFSITANSETLSLASGGNAGTQLSISQANSNQQGGLTGPVNLTCISPSAALTCTLGSASVNLPANYATVNTTVTLTSIPGKASLSPIPHLPGKEMIGGGSVLATLICFLVPKRTRKLSMLLSMLILLGVGLGATGCSHTNTPAAAGPVSYLVSVRANASGVQHSVQLKVTVQ